MCRENKIVVKTVDRKKLDFMCAGGNHQGVAANVPAHSYSSVDDILEYAKSKGEAPFIIICDEMRTAIISAQLSELPKLAALTELLFRKEEMLGLILSLQKPRAAHLNMLKLQG